MLTSRILYDDLRCYVELNNLYSGCAARKGYYAVWSCSGGRTLSSDLLKAMFTMLDGTRQLGHR